MSSLARLAARCNLALATPDDLTWARRKAGTGFSYRDEKNKPIKDKDTLQRLASLAVPPAYAEVRYAPDPRAHLQAVGRDAAGRLQYRYHADWEHVRELRKARRLAKLAEALPKLRRAIGRHLAAEAETKDFALAAVVELVALTAMRAGGENYAKEHGTRGATTLMKSNLTLEGDSRAILRFKAKGGQAVTKEICLPRFVAVLARFKALPGRRLFQYRGSDGALHPVRASEVNAFLKEASGAPISLKDFRTLVASAGVLETLAQTIPAGSARARRAQVLAAVREAAEELANTPTVCRKSYVHATVVTAFEDGALERFSRLLKGCRSPQKRAEVLARIVARAKLDVAETAAA
ncbi:DNA topoisomerase IB [Xanthobacteraceae bacterium A53D]